MRARRPGRFSREWQRQRAEQAAAERAETMELVGRIARVFGRGWFAPRRAPRVEIGEELAPYRGFRAGRARIRPTATGYDEPAEPAERAEPAGQAPRGPGNEHPWLDDLDDLDGGPPVSGPVIGD